MKIYKTDVRKHKRKVKSGITDVKKHKRKIKVNDKFMIKRAKILKTYNVPIFKNPEKLTLSDLEHNREVRENLGTEYFTKNFIKKQIRFDKYGSYYWHKYGKVYVNIWGKEEHTVIG